MKAQSIRFRWKVCLVLMAPIFTVSVTGWTQSSGNQPLMTEPAVVQEQSTGGYLLLGDNVDLFGVYRQRMSQQADFGLRLGFTDTGDGGVTLGGDLRYYLGYLEPTFRLDFAAVSGLQLGFAGNAKIISIPIGVSVGTTVAADYPVTLYILPHARIDTIDPDGAKSNTQINIAVDFGSALRLSRQALVPIVLTISEQVAFTVGFNYLF